MPRRLLGYGHGERVRRFGRTYARVFREGVGRRKFRLILVVAASFLGAAAQGSAIALLVFLVHLIESKERTGVAFIDERLGMNVPSVIAAAGLLFVFLLFSAVAAFFAAAQTRALARAYHESASLDLISRYEGTDVFPPGFGYEQLDLSLLINRDSRILGVALDTLIGLIQPGLLLLVYLVSLFLISWQATLCVAPVPLLLLPVLLRFSVYVQRESREFYDRRARDAARAVNRCLTLLTSSNLRTRNSPALADELYRRDVEIKAFFDGFDHILLASSRGLLITSVSQAVLVCVALIALGSLALSGAMSWGVVVVYVVACSQVAARLKQVFAMLTNLTRFFPLVASYQRCRDAIEKVPSAVLPRAGARPRLALVAAGLDAGRDERIELASGDRVLFITDRSLDRFAFGEMLAALRSGVVAGGDALDGAVFRSSRYTFRPGTIAGNLLGNDVGSRERTQRAREMLRELGVEEEIDALEDGWDTTLDTVTWNAMSARARRACRVIPFVLSEHAIVFVDTGLLQPADDAERVLDLFEDQVVVVTGTGWPTGHPWTGPIVVAEGASITGIGDWSWWMAAGGAAMAVVAGASEEEEEQLDPTLDL